MSLLTFWMTVAAICLVLEFLLPGAVLIFIGLAAGLVATSLFLGWIETWIAASNFFLVSSLFLVIVVRTLFLKFFPGDSRVDNVDEDDQAVGALVEVIQGITPAKPGRIRYRQSTWEAESEESIQVGEKALIVARSGQVWKVQSILRGSQRL